MAQHEPESMLGDVREHIRARTMAAGTHVLPAVRPLAVPDHTGSEPVPVGSAVLIWHRGTRYVITAAHVLDQPGCAYYIGTGAHWVELPQPFRVTTPPGGNREKDQYDFGFRALDGEFAARLDGCRFLTADEIGTGEPVEFEPPRRSKFLAVGYPLNRFSYRRGSRTTVPENLAYVATVADRERHAAARLHPAHHVVVDLDHKAIVGPDGVQSAPKFDGLSGGGMFRMPSLERLADPSPPRLAAITIEQRRKERLMIGVRIDLILAAIDRDAEVSAGAI